MKKLLLAMLPIVLSGCGGTTKDFSVDVEKPGNLVLAELGALDGSALSGIGLKPFVRYTDEAGKVRFVIPAEGYDDGEVVFWVHDRGSRASTVDVAVDLPRIRVGNQELSESKAEDVMEEAVRKWAQGAAKGSGSLGEVKLTLTGFSVATQAFGKGKDPKSYAMESAVNTMFADAMNDDEGDSESASYSSEPEFGDPTDRTVGAFAPDSYDEGGTGYDSEESDWGTPQ